MAVWWYNGSKKERSRIGSRSGGDISVQRSSCFYLRTLVSFPERRHNKNIASSVSLLRVCQPRWLAYPRALPLSLSLSLMTRFRLHLTRHEQFPDDAFPHWRLLLERHGWAHGYPHRIYHGGIPTVGEDRKTRFIDEVNCSPLFHAYIPCASIPSFTARALCCTWFHLWICLFPLVPLSELRAARSNSRPNNQVPALRAGVVSASRPRQAGMVIGVVPRYDPHGMGMPLMSRPGGGSGGDVPATGRQRAATASSLEQPREVCWCCFSHGRYVGAVSPVGALLVLSLKLGVVRCYVLLPLASVTASRG